MNSVKLIVKYDLERYVFKDVFRHVMDRSVQEIRFPKVGERILLSEVFSLIGVFQSSAVAFMILIEIRNSEVIVI